MPEPHRRYRVLLLADAHLLPVLRAASLRRLALRDQILGWARPAGPEPVAGPGAQAN